MKFWQIAVIGTGLILLLAATLWTMPPVMSATRGSQWFVAVIFGYFFGNGAASAGIIYGVWRLGDRA